MRHGHDHVLALDQVLVVHVADRLGDFGAARRRELRLQRGQVFLDDGLDARARAQDIEIIGDLGGELVQFGGDFVAAQRGQALQPQVENRLRLFGRQPRIAFRRNAMARIVDQQHHRRHILGRPVARHQLLARFLGVGRGADQLDHFVDIGNGDSQTHQNMGAVARLVEQELGAPRHDFFAERDEGDQHVLERHHQRTAAVERHGVDAETRLQRRETIKLVHHHVALGIALQFDHHAIAVAIGLVAQIGNAVDLLVAHQFSDALDHRRLVHLIGNFGNDDRFAVLAQGLEGDLAAHHHRAAAGVIGAVDAGAAENDAAGREIRTGHDLDEVVGRDRRIVDHCDGRVDDLAEIVRRNIGRHADGNAAGAIDQQIRIARRQNLRFAFAAVIVFLEVDSVLVDVVKQSHRRLGQLTLGVTHGGGRIAVDRAEIALPVDELQAHREVLRHAHQGVIDRAVAMRMIFAHHVADDARRFDVFLVRGVALLVHRIEDAPVHRLQAVANVGQRAAHDHAHRVIEIRTLHLFGNGDRAHVGGLIAPRFGCFGVGQRGVPAGL